MSEMIELGEKIHDANISGQKVEVYPDYFLWKLRNGIYVTAGERHWPNAVDNGEPKPGISIQQELFQRSIIDNKKILVEDVQEDKYRLLTNETKVETLGALKTLTSGVELLIVPIDCFRTVEVNS